MRTISPSSRAITQNSGTNPSTRTDDNCCKKQSSRQSLLLTLERVAAKIQMTDEKAGIERMIQPEVLSDASDHQNTLIVVIEKSLNNSAMKGRFRDGRQ